MEVNAGDADEQFFASLPEVKEFDEVVRRDGYSDAPASWYVVITDVRGSTRAIEEGRYRDVNALGVASIIAVKNAAPDLELPYVFGGDGATLLVPGTRLPAIEAALRGTRDLARGSFDLELRIARVAVAELRAAGHAVRVERYRLSQHVALAMFSGAGFQVAERWVKDEHSSATYCVNEGPALADFEGFECRWQPMQSRRGEVVCLLVVALDPEDLNKEAVYRLVLNKLEQILGASPSTPITRQSLRPLALNGDYSVEARIRSQTSQGDSFNKARANARKRTLIGRALMVVGAEAGGFNGRTYPEEFVENTDFRKFDETLRMVLDLTAAESGELEQWLAELHRAGRVAYGIHRSASALATCMVKAYQGDHVHFVDGADGGYALAAKALKVQLARIQGQS